MCNYIENKSACLLPRKNEIFSEKKSHIYLLHSSCVPYDKDNRNKKQILSVRSLK